MSTNLKNAFHDLNDGLRRYPLWMALGWNDVRTRYQRSKLGVIWASLSVLIFVGTLGPIYATIMEIELRIYSLHLFLGFVTWNYISGIMMECSREFTNSASYLVSFRISYFTLLLRVVWRNTVVVLYQMLAFIIFTAIFMHPAQLNWFIAPFALLLIALNALWLGLLMSVLTTRFRDIGEIVNNLIRLIFFATPIMWMPMQKPQLEDFANLNPFYHLIEIFRSPLLNGNFNTLNWQVSLAVCLVGWCVAFSIFSRYRERIAFWL